uniref:Ig-like domain-containing protein n=1 Tax=Poecilia reticulata TaxID=8081 RepID=A0A3P9N0H5_POERE
RLGILLKVVLLCHELVFVTRQPNRPQIFSDETITLSCEVQGGETTEWMCEWKRDGSVIHRTYKENRDIDVRQGGIYMCMGMREKTYFYISNKVFVTRQPNRPQIFSGESITLSCEVQGGETTEWTCEWKRDGSVIHRTYSKDWTFIVSESSSADYMCQCEPRDDWFSSTQWSEAISLSVSSDLTVSKPKAQLNSNSREIPAGGSVTLTCTVDASSSGWKYFWYKERDSSELLTGGEADFPSNGQMSVSEEGLYWCRGGRGEPVYYTDYSVRISITKNGDLTKCSQVMSWFNEFNSV